MRYIVKIKDDVYIDQERAKLAATTNVTVVNVLEELRYIHIDCAESVLDTIDKTGINSIHADGEMILQGNRTTINPGGNYWHLDAITKRDFTTYNNSQYSYPDTEGQNADLYIVDSGIAGASFVPTGDLSGSTLTFVSFAAHWQLTLDYGLKAFASEASQEIKLTCEHLDPVPAVPGSAVHWNITTAQGNQYDFTWDGSSANDTITNGFSNTPEPDITLIRGATYEFDTTSAGATHPLEIRTALGGSAYNTGVTNNGVAQAIITFVVPTNAPNTLYYQCPNHANMEGTLNIVEPNSLTPSGLRFDHLHTHSQGVFSAPNIQATTFNQAIHYQDCDWEVSVAASNTMPGVNAKEMVRDHNLGKTFRIHLDANTGVQTSVAENSLKNSALGLKDGIEHTELIGRVEGLPGFDPYAFTSHATPAHGSEMEDTQGHGTHVALCAAGLTSGVASKARLYAVKVMDMGGAGSNSGFISDIQAGLDAIITHHNAKSGARESIINASIGASPKAPTPVIYADEVNQSGVVDLPYSDSLKLAVAAGINVVVSAGNGFDFHTPEPSFMGPMNAELGEPGIVNGGQWNIDTENTQKIICVGATNYNDNAATFSNYGPSVDVWAPGNAIICPKWDVGNGWYDGPNSQNHQPGSPDWTDGGSAPQFGSINGTSFASPIVAGILALRITEVPSQTPADVKTWLTTTGTTNRVANLATWKALGITDPLYSTNASAGWKIYLNTTDHDLEANDMIQFYGVDADIAGVTKEELVKDDWVVNAVTVDGGGSGVDIIALDARDVQGWKTVTANATVNGGGASIRWAKSYDHGTTAYLHEGTDGIRHYLYRDGGGHNDPVMPQFHDTNNAKHQVAWRQPTEVESINNHVYQEIVDLLAITYGTAAGDLGTYSQPSGALTFDLSQTRTTWANEPLTPTYSVTNGSLPPGLTLSSTGQLTGTPAFPNVTTQYSFTVVSATVGGSAAYTMTLTEAEEVGLLYKEDDISTTGQVKGKTIRTVKTVWFGDANAQDTNYDVKARPGDEDPTTDADIQCFSGNAYKFRDHANGSAFTCRFKAPSNPEPGDTFSIGVLTGSAALGPSNFWYLSGSGSNVVVDFGSGDVALWSAQTGNSWKYEWIYEYTSAVGWIRTGLVNNEWS